MNKNVFLSVILITTTTLFVACGSSDKKSNEGDFKNADTTTARKIQMSQSSSALNTQVNNMVDGYVQLKDAFVEADMAAVKEKSTAFIKLVQSIDSNELKKDASMFMMLQGNIGDLISNTKSILVQRDITEMRRDFSSLSESLYTFLRTINYSGPTLYFQNCPMAFNDEEPANWISKSAQIINPYLGKKHPKYKSGMLNCGETRDSIITKQ